MYLMSIHEKAVAELTKAAREAFMKDDWEMPDGWMDQVVPAYGMTPRQYVATRGEEGIASLSNHIHGIARGIHA